MLSNPHLWLNEQVMADRQTAFEHEGVAHVRAEGLPCQAPASTGGLALHEVREEHLNPCTCRLDIDGGGLRELDGVGLARAQLRDPAATDRLLAEPYAAVVLDGSAEPCDPVGEFAQVGAEVAVVSDVARVEADSPVAAVSAADETDVGELAPCDVRDESDNPVLVAHEAPP